MSEPKPRQELRTRSEQMRLVRSKDTKPELLVRKSLHKLGYRYRLHAPNLPGRPDMVFAGRQKVIFIHGCFWHRHEKCKKSRTPKSNMSYWLPKFSATLRRDQATEETLTAMGWRYIVVWECELKMLPEAISKICGFLDD